jgi:hypothetical protein
MNGLCQPIYYAERSLSIETVDSGCDVAYSKTAYLRFPPLRPTPATEQTRNPESSALVFNHNHGHIPPRLDSFRTLQPRSRRPPLRIKTPIVHPGLCRNQSTFPILTPQPSKKCHHDPLCPPPGHLETRVCRSLRVRPLLVSDEGD